MTYRSSLHHFFNFTSSAIANFNTMPFVRLLLFSMVELYLVMPPLKTLLLLLETSSVVDKKWHSLQLYYRRAPLYSVSHLKSRLKSYTVLNRNLSNQIT